MSTKLRARTEDEQIELLGRAIVLLFDTFGAGTITRINVSWALTDMAIADLQAQVQRELAGEKVPKPKLISETAFRANLRKAIVRFKPKRPKERSDVAALREYRRARQVFEAGIVELGLDSLACRRSNRMVRANLRRRVRDS